MSYGSLLTHRCDIYHLKTRPKSSTSFGIPIDDLQEEYYYDEQPDLTEVECYFTEKNQNVIQMEPNANITQSYRVHFLASADVRVNSKMVWEGTTFKSQKPRKVKNHHQEVTVNRNDTL
ncbi:DUF3599 family protein [Oceanobacillus sp. CF4.6]|uniref:DUF3599 family protein n=1 Tax=Oceanobacillus sp. CF4.6 TaxID=3373080 RepID=UPI003EE4CEC5